MSGWENNEITFRTTQYLFFLFLDFRGAFDFQSWARIIERSLGKSSTRKMVCGNASGRSECVVGVKDTVCHP